jgi:hypothetical protein
MVMEVERRNQVLKTYQTIAYVLHTKSTWLADLIGFYMIYVV